MQDLMSRLKASRSAIGSAPTLMWGCSTHRHQPIAPKPSQRATDARRKKREELMRRESSKLSMDHSHQSSFPPREEWVHRQWPLMASKHTASYSATMRMIRCKISFSLINSAVMCLMRARSSFRKPMRALDLIDTLVDVIVNEGRFWSN